MAEWPFCNRVNECPRYTQPRIEYISFNTDHAPPARTALFLHESRSFQNRAEFIESRFAEDVPVHTH
jgi:hypothetical protein